MNIRPKLYAEQLASVKAQEEACVLPKFDGDVAWELGAAIRALCQQHTFPAVIYIAHATSTQLLFFAVSRPGTLVDHMRWVKRKEATVLRWGVSTLQMRAQMIMEDGQDPLCTFRTKYDLPSPDDLYTIVRGGFPIRVRNVEGVVGVIAVHGTPDDHNVIVEGVREFLARNQQG